MATYYVDFTGGLDENDGLSEENAWKTINKVQTTLTGDQSDTIVKFKCDEIWRGNYVVAGYGTSGHPFVHDYYGAGDLPKIYASSDQLLGWTLYAGNTYYKDGFDFEPSILALDGECYTKAVDEDSITSTDRWYRDSGANRMYIYSIGDPSSYYSEIERGQSNYCLQISDKSYIKFYNMDFRYASLDNIQFVGTNSHIDLIDCIIWGISTTGIVTPSLISTSYITVDGIIAHGMNRSRHNNVFEIAGSYVTIKNCEVSRGSHTGMTLQLENSIVEHNDCWSDGQGGNYYGRTIETIGGGPGTHIRYNMFRNAGYGNDLCHGPDQFTGDGYQIYYNIFKNSEYRGMQIYYNPSFTTANIKFYNNVIYGSKGYGFWGNNGGLGVGLEVKNNLIFNNDEINHYQVGFLDPNARAAFTFEDNCIWDSATSDTVSDQGARTVEYMNTTYAYWSNNIASDPKCVNPVAGDFHLQSDSPCRNVGQDVGLTKDYDGVAVPQETYPAIGAFEFLFGEAGYSVEAKNAMLDALGGFAVYASLHDGDPGTTGENELSGGNPSYARKAITWNLATGGIMDSSNQPVFDIPAGKTIKYMGLWSAITGGVFYLSAPIVNEAFASQGTHILTDGDLDLNA